MGTIKEARLYVLMHDEGKKKDIVTRKGKI